MNGKRSTRAGLAIAAALALVCISSLPALAANKLIVKDSTGTNDVFVISDVPKVGVGTNAPLTALHVTGNSLNASQIYLQFSGTTNPAGGGGIIAAHNNAAGAAPNNGDRLGYFLYGSTVNNIQMNAAGITSRAESVWSSTTAPANISLETTPPNSMTVSGAPARVERVRISAGGNVGIGTTAPAQKLDVSGGIRLNSTGTQPTCNAANRGTLWLIQGATDVLQICAQVGGTPTWRNVTLQ